MLLVTLMGSRVSLGLVELKATLATPPFLGEAACATDDDPMSNEPAVAIPSPAAPEKTHEFTPSKVVGCNISFDRCSSHDSSNFRITVDLAIQRYG